MRLSALMSSTGRKIGVACKTLDEFIVFVKKHFNLVDKEICITDCNGNEIVDNDYFVELDKDSVLTVKERKVKMIIGKYAGKQTVVPFTSLSKFLFNVKKTFNLEDCEIVLYDAAKAEILSDDYFQELDENSIIYIGKLQLDFYVLIKKP